jgi:uncharacterized protein YutE (UPF0331/DUF86 family)
MDMVDRELVLRKLSDLDTYARQLEEFRGLAAEEYRADWKVQRIVDRTLHLAIEVCVDIAGHVIADRSLRAPATYAEAFEVLGEEGVLGGPLVQRMVRMAGFRNVLVHEYARIDPARVVAVLHERLGDFAGFRDAILAALKD